jgi:hypothetical protein
MSLAGKNGQHCAGPSVLTLGSIIPDAAPATIHAMTRRRLIIVQAAVGGLLLAGGIDGHQWLLIVLGAATIVLAVADGGADRAPQPPARNWTQRVLRYFGLGWRGR